MYVQRTFPSTAPRRTVQVAITNDTPEARQNATANFGTQETKECVPIAAMEDGGAAITLGSELSYSSSKHQTLRVAEGVYMAAMIDIRHLGHVVVCTQNCMNGSHDVHPTFRARGLTRPNPWPQAFGVELVLAWEEVPRGQVLAKTNAAFVLDCRGVHGYQGV